MGKETRKGKGKCEKIHYVTVWRDDVFRHEDLPLRDNDVGRLHQRYRFRGLDDVQLLEPLPGAGELAGGDGGGAAADNSVT